MARSALLNQFGRPMTSADYAAANVVKPYNKSDQQTCEKILKLFQYGNKAYNSLFQIQRQCVDILNDRHWTSEEEDFAEASNRTLLTINVTRPYAMQVAGMQRMSRTNMRVEPFDAVDDPELAEMAQKLLQSIEYNSRSDIKDAVVFQDGMSGLGNWEVFIDYSSDPLGEVRIGRCEPYSVLHDTDTYDPMLDDRKWSMRMIYMRPDAIKTKFGKGSDLRFDKREYELWWEDLGSSDIEGFNAKLNPDLVLNGRYLVLQLSELKQKAVRYIIDEQAGQVVGEYPFEAGSTQAFMMANEGFKIMEFMKPIVHSTIAMPYFWTVFTEVDEDFSIIPLIPFASVRNGGRLQDSSSWNNSLRGLQTELNMRHSNQQEYVTRSLRGGYWVFRDSGGQVLIDQLDEFGFQIGKSYLVSGSPGGEPRPILPADILKGEAFLEDSSLKYFEHVTGLTAAQVTGSIDERGESGVKRKERREESRTTLYQTIDDFNHMNALKCEAALERQVSILNPLKAVRIIGRDNNAQFIRVAENMIGNLRQIRKWDIRVLDGPYVAAQKESENEKMRILFETTAKISPNAAKAVLPRMWRNSGIENADEIADDIEQILMAEAQLAAIPPAPGANPGLNGSLPAVA